MTAIKTTEQSQGSQRHTSDLDNRYGKIGISAVAAALCTRGERPAENESQHIPYDRD
jgi:hypothetical protein